MKQWDIWLAHVPYEEDDGRSSQRPALVVMQAAEAAKWITFKLTSAPPRSNYPGEYRLLQWREAGLKKPTTVRLSKVVILHDADFIHKIGHLQRADMAALTAIATTMYAMTHVNTQSDETTPSQRPPGISEAAWRDYERNPRLLADFPTSHHPSSESSTSSKRSGPASTPESVLDVIAGTITEALNQKTAGTDTPQPRPRPSSSRHRKGRRK